MLAHHDPAGLVSGETLGLIDALRDAGRSVFVASNAGRLTEASRAALRTRCAGWLTRANTGHDFSAWRAALIWFGLPRPDTTSILLVNDSLHGPCAALTPLLARMPLDDADVWAATDSRQRGWHLQSFFLLVGARALRSPAWSTFWAGIHPVRSREWAIRAGELRFSRAMSAGGLRLAAIWPIDEMLARHRARQPESAAEAAHAAAVERYVVAGHPLNASIHLWRALLEAGFPFAKRDLTGRNRGRIADAAEVMPCLDTAARRSGHSGPSPPPAGRAGG